MIGFPVLATGVTIGLIAARALTADGIRKVATRPCTEPRTVRPRGPLRLLGVGRRPNRNVRPTPLAAWADDLARALRRGSTLRGALTTVIADDPTIARHSEPLRRLLARGATVAEACDGWSDEIAELSATRVELLNTLSTVIAAAAVLGGTASAPLDRFASVMRQRASDDLERSAQSAQARMSARVLTIVPLSVLALLVVTDPDVRDVVTHPFGATVVGIGAVMNAIGGWWMRHLVGPAAESSAT